MLPTGCNGNIPRNVQQGDSTSDSGLPLSEANSGNAFEVEFERRFSVVANSALPAVVSVQTERGRRSAPFQPFGFFNDPSDRQGAFDERTVEGLGSGTIIREDGIVLTNYHVVTGSRGIRIRLSDEREFSAEVVGTDAETDLAVLRIEGDIGILPILPLGNSDEVEIGQWVMAIGSPFGLFQSVTTGIISATGRVGTGITTYGNFMQTDAAINPGNSGGPLVNLRGEMIGVNTAIFSQTGGHQGVGFAIPSNLARRIAEELLRDGSITRGWLGVSVQPITPEVAEALNLDLRDGALINDVVPKGPAALAGLRQGDVITAIDGDPITNVNDLLNRVASISPGTRTRLTVLREGARRILDVKVEKRRVGSFSRINPPNATAPPS